MGNKGAQITIWLTALAIIISLLNWLMPFIPYARSPIDRTGRTAVAPIPGSSTTEPESENKPPSTSADLPDAGERSPPEPQTGALDAPDSSDGTERSSEDGRKKEPVPGKQPETEDDTPGKPIWVPWPNTKGPSQPRGPSAPWPPEEVTFPDVTQNDTPLNEAPSRVFTPESQAPDKIGGVGSVTRSDQSDLEADPHASESNPSPPGSVDQPASSRVGGDCIQHRPGIWHCESIFVIAPPETRGVRPDTGLRLPKLPPTALAALDGKEVVIHAVVDRQGRCSIGRIEPTEVNQYIVQRIVSDLIATRWTVENTDIEEYPIKIIYRW